jgi:hypothetical protein
VLKIMASFLGNSARRTARIHLNPFTKGQSRNFSAKNLRPGGWPGPNPYFYVLFSVGCGIVGGFAWKQWQMQDRAYSMAFDKWYKMVKQEQDRERIEKAFEADEEFKNRDPAERAATVYKVKKLIEALPDEFKTSARFESIYKLWEPYFPDADLFKPDGEEEESEVVEEETETRPPQQPTPTRDASIDDSKLKPSEELDTHQNIAHVSQIEGEGPIPVPQPATTEKP